MNLVHSLLRIVESVSYQAGHEQPTGLEPSFVRRVKGDRLPYVQRMTFGQEWKRLDCGGIDQACQVVVVNQSNAGRRVIPTPEEAAVESRVIVEIGGLNCPFAKVRPGESCRFEPVTELWVRSMSGEARILVAVFPGDE